MKRLEITIERRIPALPFWSVGCLLLFFFVIQTRAASLSFQDSFTNREVTTAASDRLDGNNTNATIEPNEPNHGGKIGGRSVWLSWIAPTNGVATFWTANSTSDTLLSAYYLQPGDTTLDKLHEVARNDDDPANPDSKLSFIQFGARAGQRYEIAVDGFHGSAGDFRLRWDFVETTSAPPVIVSVPIDQAIREGDTVTLAVDIQSSTPLDLDWRYNGNSFDNGGPLLNSFGRNTSTLVITNFQGTNVGTYSLRVRMDLRNGGQVVFYSTPVELQLNSEGITNALARDKLFDSAASSLIGDDDSGHLGLTGGGKMAKPKALTTGVVRGYDGSQIFNTTYATTDPTEPHHCGFIPSASYWFTYQPPTNGTAVINTGGSHYDNVLAVYAYSGTVTSYADLIPIACDHGSAGVNASTLEFAALKAQQYAIVVSGVNSAKGVANLNYHFDVTRPPLPPTLTNAPQPLVVCAGTNVTLSPGVIGSAPLHFAWSNDGAPMSAATNRVLQLLNVLPANSGSYVLTVSNHIGSLIAAFPLRVVIPPHLDLSVGSGDRNFSFTTVAGQRYVIEQSDALGSAWVPLSEPFVSDGSSVVLSNSLFIGARFYRIRVE